MRRKSGRSIVDTTRHICVDCPYAAVVIDDVARAWAAATRARLPDLRPMASLLKEVGGDWVSSAMGL